MSRNESYLLWKRAFSKLIFTMQVNKGRQIFILSYFYNYLWKCFKQIFKAKIIINKQCKILCPRNLSQTIKNFPKSQQYVTYFNVVQVLQKKKNMYILHTQAHYVLTVPITSSTIMETNTSKQYTKNVSFLLHFVTKEIKLFFLEFSISELCLGFSKIHNM